MDDRQNTDSNIIPPRGSSFSSHITPVANDSSFTVEAVVDDDVPDWIRPLINDTENGDIKGGNGSNDFDHRRRHCWTAKIRKFDDGHTPERLNQSDHPTRIVDYQGPCCSQKKDSTADDDDETFDHNSTKKTTRQCYVHANAFPEHLVDELYLRTCTNDDGPAWGTYVTREQIEQYWQKEPKQPVDSQVQEDDFLFVETAARYLEYAMRSSLGDVDHDCENSEIGRPTKQDTAKSSSFSPSNSVCYQYDIDEKKMTMVTSSSTWTKSSHNNADTDHRCHHTSTPLWSYNDMPFIHGVALWGLRAQVGSKVPYHLDYAEQIRYLTNVIVPPILAGTLQCTCPKMKGGSFQLAMEGISHYTRHGYKCKLSPLDSEPHSDRDGDEPNVRTNIDINASDIDSSQGKDYSEQRHNGIVEIQYKYNQLILHSGDLPHWSTPVESIDESDGKAPVYRVIIGFNVFPGGGVGERVEAAPEHSKAFRQLVSSCKSRRVTSVCAEGRAVRSKNRTVNTGSCERQQHQQKENQLLSAKDLCRNKPLGQLLVRAKRLVDRKNFLLGREWLERDLPKFLPSTVQDLVNRFSSTYASNVTAKNDEENTPVRLHPDVVRAFITQKLRDGTFRAVKSSNPSIDEVTTSGLVPMATEITTATLLHRE